MDIEKVLKLVQGEREHQDNKWGAPRFNTFCEWGSILAEEAGELCKELNELNFGRGDRDRAVCEAVQVAAVAVAVIQQYETAEVATCISRQAVDGIGYEELA